MDPRPDHADALAEIFRSEREEIERYRWLESEKIGRDIGFKRAAEEWKSRHYSDWQRAVLASGDLHPLVPVIWPKREEIANYKWLASEKAGRDIGWQRAVSEWEKLFYSAGHMPLARELPAPKPEKSARLRTKAAKKSKRPFSPEHKQNLSASVEAWWATRRNQVRQPENISNAN